MYKITITIKIIIKGAGGPWLAVPHCGGGVSVGKDDMVGDLVAIVPGVEQAVLGVIVYLRGVGILILKEQPRDDLRVGVRIKGVGDVGIPLVVAVDRIQDPTDDKAIPVEVLAQPRPPCGLLLGAEIGRIQLAQHDHLLVEALIAYGWVDDPQAVLIHGKVHIRVASPPPRGGLLIGHIVQHGPGGHVALLQVVLDDVAREGPVIVEGAVVDNVPCPNPAVRELVGVAPATCVGRHTWLLRPPFAVG